MNFSLIHQMFCKLFFDLCERIELRWGFSLQNIEIKIHSRDDAMLTKYRLCRLARKDRMVVLLAQVTKPNVTQLRCGILSKQPGGLLVVQMSLVAADALLQVLRVLAHHEHVDVVIRLEH